MRLRLRWLLFMVLALLRDRMRLFESSSISIRVLPNDVDVRFMTNDRYFAYMDIGRNDLIIRLGLFGKLLRGSSIPLVAMQSVRYRHSARLLQQLELRTRVLCWRENSVWFEQEFVADRRSIALGCCEVKLHMSIGAPSVAKLLADAGHGEPVSPPTPAIVEALEKQEQVMRQHQQEFVEQ